MASRSAKKHHAKGGKVQVYDAKGSKEVEAAEDKKDEFKKGGAKHKHGGHVEGEKKHHAGHKPRTHKRKAGGRTPYSSGHEVKTEKESGATNSGHEGQRPPFA